MRNLVATSVTIFLAALSLAGCGNSTNALTYSGEEEAWEKARDEARKAWDKKDLASAEQHYLSAVEHARHVESTSPRHLAETLEGLAAVYAQQKKFEQAKETYQAVIDLTRKLENPDASELYTRLVRMQQGRAHLALGKIFIEEKQYDKAEQEFQQGLNVKFSSNLLPGIAELKLAYAELLDKTGKDPQKAKKLRKEAADTTDGLFEDL